MENTTEEEVQDNPEFELVFQPKDSKGRPVGAKKTIKGDGFKLWRGWLNGNGPGKKTKKKKKKDKSSNKKTRIKKEKLPTGKEAERLAKEAAEYAERKIEEREQKAINNDTDV